MKGKNMRRSKSGAIKTVDDLRRGYKGGPRFDLFEEKKSKKKDKK